MAPLSPLSPARPAGRRSPHPARRRRRRNRLVPLLVLAVLAAGAGAFVALRQDPAEREVAQRFVTAWTRNDLGAMHRELSPDARAQTPLRRFRRLYENAAETTTLERITPAGRLVELAEGEYEIPLRARTKRFGTLRGVLRLSVEGDDDATGVVWNRHLVFPGLRRGERLSRTVEMPERGTLQARDGTVLAEGPDRTSEIGPLAAEIAGSVGPIPEDKAEEYRARGYPEDATVGLTGLERQFEERLAGDFGGELRAGRRVLARREPQRPTTIRTSIDIDLQGAAVQALAGRFGGIAVVRPRTGEVLAAAGIAWSAPQPPGSVFKIITLAGALEAKIARVKDSFPVQTSTTLSGVELENANGESCGGSLSNSFAHSCNTVFAPLGARLGPRRLYDAAERFGFNQPIDIAGAATPSIPSADELGDDLGVGSSAIGQGLVQSTPLHLATVAAAIANKGVYTKPTLLRGERGETNRAVSERTARTVARMMRLVVTNGTGTAAAISGVKVAGKTGTAELRDTTPDEETPPPEEGAIPADDRTDTDAWFTAFAPANRPQLAVTVLLVGQGSGGETAAPAARLVLEAGLRR